MKLELVTRREVSFVELQRDKKHSLGLTIRDGTEDDFRPVVKSVKMNSPAARSCAVAKGDVVLSVNGVSTTTKRSKEVRQMLDDAGPNVSLQVQYKTHETRILRSCVYQKQRLTQRFQKVKGSFGFLLRKCSKYSFMMEYPIVSDIKEGSAVHKRGHVQDGDRLLKIDNISLSWMSLPYIASLLQAKDEADFTFEYSVGVVNFAETDMKIDLDIDTPLADLGISLRMCDEECSVMYISSLRQGSIAERCGVFSEGDVVLSINGTDVKDLTVSKAYFLLRNVKKCRKISFISNRREVHTPKKNIDLYSNEDAVSTGSCTSDIPESDWKHINTPVSAKFTFSGHEKYNFQNSCFIEQIKSMDKFQNMVSIMSSLKQALSALTRQAFKGTQISLNQTCTSCNNTKHAVKLCTSCLAKMNVKCAQSMDILRELVAHFVKFSSNMFDENADQLVNISLKNVIHMLRETLPNIYRIPELQEYLSNLAEKIACADPSCNICDKEVKTIMMIAKQLLLVLSIREDSVEFADLAEHLVCCLLEVDFPCCGDSGYSLNSNISHKHNSSSENLSEIVCVGNDEVILSDTTCCHLRNNSETESKRTSLEGDFNTLQIKTEICRDYLKLTHIQSVSESKTSASPMSVQKPNGLDGTCSRKHSTFPEEPVEEMSTNSFVSDDLTGSRARRFGRNMKLNKIWRSLDSLAKVRRHPGYNKNDTNTVHKNTSSCTNTKVMPTIDKNINSTTDSHCKNSTSDFKNQNLPRLLYCRRKASDSASSRYSSSANRPGQRNFRNIPQHVFSSTSSNGENIADINSDSTSSSSRFVADKKNSLGTKQTYSDTNNLTLRNDGDGFGLVISDKSNINEVPIIEAIKPYSPAEKEGVLQLGDRILAINGVMTLNLSPEQFSALKTNAFAALTITLKVEFDVWDEKYMFGTFNVVLYKTINIGLIYEDVKAGDPLVIKGVVKGSAAHRSGQLFPRDDVVFLKCKINEIYDPVTCGFKKERTVILTIKRDPKKVLGLDRTNREDLKGSDIRVPHPTPCPTEPSICYSNPSFHREYRAPKSGENFEVRQTLVRTSRKNSLVVEHELTLYRDSKRFDFGLLLGRDPATGHTYVKDIRPDGPAHKSGVIQKYDRILEVDGELVNKNVEYSVIELFSQADDKVDILIRKVYNKESSKNQTKIKRIHQ